MKIKDVLKVSTIFIWSVLFYACGGSDDNPSTVQPETPEEEKATITCSVDNIVFDSENGSQVLNFTTDKEWSIAVLGNISWCTLSSANGNAGAANIAINVTENTAFSDRNVTLVIKCGTATHSIVVTQKQQDALLLSTSKYEVAQEGGTIEVSVKTNTDYQWEIASGAQSWIKESASRTLTGYSHTFTIATNQSSTKREGEIYFRNATQTETVKIYQSGATEKVLILTQNHYTVSDAGETITVEIKSNVDYAVQMPGVDWVKAKTNGRALSSHTLSYIIEPNDLYESRSAKIVFYDKYDNNLKETLTIVQKQKDVLTVSKKSFEVDYKSSTIEIFVFSNIEYEVSIVSPWIKQTTGSRATKTDKLYFLIEENTGESRQGQIIVTNTEKNIREEIVVKQGEKSQQPPKEDKNPDGTVDDMNWGN